MPQWRESGRLPASEVRSWGWQAGRMADSAPDPRTSIEPSPTEDEPGSRSLTQRWWWQAAVIVIAGLAIIGFQWEVISVGESIAATWVMVGIGAVAVVMGAVLAWRSRPGRSEQDA